MIAKIAWRNLWRNKLRSLVVLLSVITGITGGMVAASFTRDFSARLVDHALWIENTHLTIKPEEQLHSGRQQIITDARQLTRQLENIAGISQILIRTSVDAVMSSSAAASNVRLTGIFPDDETAVSNLKQLITKGSYFEEDIFQPVLIGAALAKDLGVSVNARLVATFQNPGGEILSTVFQVTGIYSSEHSAFERRNVFVLHDQLVLLKNMEKGQCDEIGIQLTGGPGEATQMALKISHELPGYSVISWKTMRPEVAFFHDYTGLVNTFIAGIILFALSMGVVNTMLMAVRERSRETAMLRAIGMKNSSLLSMIAIETMFITLLGAAIAMLISWFILRWTSITGIDLTPLLEGGYQQSREYRQAGTMVTVVYPGFSMVEFFRFAIMVTLTAILASIWPARMMLKQQITSIYRQMG